MPSSVDASAATGTTDSPASRQRRDVFVEVVGRPADRDHGGAGLGRHARDRRADAATTGAGHHDDAAVEAQQIASGISYCPDNIMVLCILQNTIPQRLSRRQGPIWRASALLSGLDGLIASVHDVRRTDRAAYAAADTRRSPTGWRLERLTAPSRLFGANGLRTGPDGRVYIAQVTGSQISALDLTTGAVETISPKGSDIIAPDDVAFDDDGNLYATEVMDGRVSVRDADGRSAGAARRPAVRERHHRAPGPAVRRRVPRRRPADGTRSGDGGAPRILLENLPSPNAMEVGPDGLLYFPLMTANEIWRIDPDGGEPQRRRRRPRRARCGEVRLRRLHRVHPGGQRTGAAHRPAHRRQDACWPS